MKKVFFSIIVPVYNVENYLEECILSITSQQDVTYEIILINDGSTDESGTICDSLAVKYEQIKVIHKSNRGPSAARNTGMCEAMGEYLLFIDSDDYIAKNVLITIKKTIEEQGSPDVVFLEAIKFYSDGSYIPMGDGYLEEKINGKSYNEVLQYITTLKKYPGSACTKAIKRDIIDNTLMFNEGLVSEDVEWTYRLFKKARTYAYCSTPYYFYRQSRKGSITYETKPDKIESLLWIIETWAQKSPENCYRTIINSFVAYQFIVLMLNLAYVDSRSAKPFFKRANEMKWVLRFGKSRKCRMVFLTSIFFGVRLNSKLLKWYKGIVK